MPAGPPDLDGRLTNHALVVWGQQDSQEDNYVVVHDLVITSRSGAVLRVEEEVVTAFTHAGSMTDLHVCEQGGGQVTVLFGTTEGALHLLRLRVPRTPGCGPSDLELLDAGPGAGLGAEEGGLAAWLRPHSGAVVAVDVQPDTQNILSVGADGALFVLNPEDVAAAAASAAAAGGGDDDVMDTEEAARRGGGGGVSPYKAGSGCIGYTCGRWVDRSLFVTSRSVGGLELWDVRCPPAPVRRSRPEWGATGLGPADRGCHRSLHCLAVHPSRPDCCASGGAGGAVALWDLRLTERPMALAGVDAAAGPVWEVRFDTREAAYGATDAPTGGPTAPLPAVLFCTEDGTLARASASPAGSGAPADGVLALGWGQQTRDRGGSSSRHQVLQQLPTAINSFDVGGPFGRDIVAVTGRQTLMYTHG